MFYKPSPNRGVLLLQQLRGHAVVPCGYFIFQCTIKVFPRRDDLFQASVCESVIMLSVSWGIIEYYGSILSCQPSSCYSIRLALCISWDKFNHSLHSATVTGGCTSSNEWNQCAKWIKGATQHSKWRFLITFALHAAVFLDWRADVFNSGAHMLHETPMARYRSVLSVTDLF